MTSGIYAIVHIGHLKLYVSDASTLQRAWPSLLAQLESGSYPDTLVQAVWNQAGKQRRFTFHTLQEITHDPTVLGTEQLIKDARKPKP